jgi:hypothetical protein
MISGGTTRTKFTRLAAPASTDAIGLRTANFTAAGVFWGGFRTDSVSEQQYADGVAVRRFCEIRARWLSIQQIGLTELDRLSVGARTLRITAIRNLDEADRVAIISAEEVS